MTHRHNIGVVRREFLQLGFSGFLGMGLPGLLAGRGRAAATEKTRAKALILIFQTGGCSHIDTFDLKPNAPDRIRGDFKPIATQTPGMTFSEHLPGLAKLSDRLAIVRTMSHGNNNHLNATHMVLTGAPQPGAFFDKIASRDDYPNYAGSLDHFQPRRDGIPNGVMLPTFLMEGPLIWPGQHAGFLGARHDPWQIRRDPNRPDFKEETLHLPDGFTVERLHRRKDLLGEMASRQAELARRSAFEKDPMAEQRDLAFNLLLTGKVAAAFDLNREDPKIRDRYGRHMYGQSLLLARRLVQAGVPIVQVNMGRVQTWDNHGHIFKVLKDRLLPPTDRGVSALLEDLASLGMLEETLVVMTGEFGRTPRISASTDKTNPGGRDHWAPAFSALFAGAGVQGGKFIGQTDRLGAHPTTRAYSPADLAATIYESLGVDPAAEVRDRLNRPIRLTTGEPISALFSSATA